MQNISNFLLKNVIFTALIAIISIFLFKTILVNFYLPIFWFLLFGISVVTGIIHFVLIKLAQMDQAKFSNKFILLTGVKMIVFLAFITGYSFLNPGKAVIFLVSFLSLYLIYSFFEVILLVSFFKKKIK